MTKVYEIRLLTYALYENHGSLLHQSTYFQVIKSDQNINKFEKLLTKNKTKCFYFKIDACRTLVNFNLMLCVK